MTKQSGLGDNLYVNGVDLSNDTGSLSRIFGGPKAIPATGIDKFAYERLGGARDGGLSWSAWFNDAVGAAHPTLSALPRTDVLVSYFRGETLGGQAATCNSKQVNYDPTRANDGGLTFGVDAQANGYGLEWGNQATVGRMTDTSATNHASIDFGSASPGAFGLQAYLHVFAFTGTSVTIKLQGSSDDGGGDAFADITGGAFTLVNAAPAYERIATAAIAIERYLRVVTTGTFTVADFAVMVVRNDTEVKF